MKLQRSRAFSGYVAALVLVVITMSLSYVVYEGVRSFDPDKQGQGGTFANQVLLLQGSPDDVLRVTVNSSEPETPVALEVDGASSQNGVLYVDGAGHYGIAPSSLCLSGATTFFSVYAQTAGLLQVRSDGQAWVDGRWGASLPVTIGWNEVMISDASSCSVVTPNGTTVSGPGAGVSGVPVTGTVPSTSFALNVPCSGPSGLSQLLLVFSDGGYDQIA
jgi:hypothetical protein